MILYFSGTGNSTFIATKLATELNDTIISMNEKIKQGDYREHYSETPYIIVAPIYAWKIPVLLKII
jgi:flavodoxin